VLTWSKVLRIAALHDEMDAFDARLELIRAVQTDRPAGSEAAEPAEAGSGGGSPGGAAVNPQGPETAR
jgi:hypothetical protein